MNLRIRKGFVFALVLILSCPLVIASATLQDNTTLPDRVTGPSISGMPVFPPDHIWNTPANTLPVDSQTDAYIESIGNTSYLHADFGAGLYENNLIGIPFNIVNGSQQKKTVVFDYADESDPGPYPIPNNPLIEGGSDRHLLIIDRDAGTLYELYAAHNLADGSWSAGSGAVFNLSGYSLRPDGWTSADAAGLAILPGLIRYEEVNSGEINHAIRFTAPSTRRSYVWPARHYASSITDPAYPPMGQRFRLKSSFNTSSYPLQARVVLDALKKYGMILCDNGAPWYITGSPDEQWNNDDLHTLHRVTGTDFEAVDSGSFMIDQNSGQARILPAITTIPDRIGIYRNGGWYLDRDNSGSWNAADQAYFFGKAGDIPVAGDWNTDGKTEIGVVRNNNTWLLDASGNGVYGAGDLAYSFGKAGDVFVTGEWNTDGKTEIGVFRNGNTWLLDTSGNGVFGAGDYVHSFGKTGDIPVTGIW